MLIMKKLFKKIKEELKDSECYAEMAIQYKFDYPEVAQTAFNLSDQEYDHAMTLHKLIEKMAESEKAKGKEPLQAMKDYYEFIHEMVQEEADEIKAMWEKFKSKTKPEDHS